MPTQTTNGQVTQLQQECDLKEQEAHGSAEAAAKAREDAQALEAELADAVAPDQGEWQPQVGWVRVQLVLIARD